MVKMMKVTEMAPNSMMFFRLKETDYAYCDGIATHMIFRMTNGQKTADVMIPYDGSETLIAWDDGLEEEEENHDDFEKEGGSDGNRSCQRVRFPSCVSSGIDS